LYSSYGWNLISAVVEGAAKQDFLSYMAKNVFEPLEMKNTSADFAGRQNAARTQFYERASSGEFEIAPPVDNSYKWAGGGFLSTAEDLARFGSAHLQPGFLKQDTLTLFFTPQKTNDGKEINVGIGWFVDKDADGHRIYSHSGGSVGGSSFLLVHPDAKVVFAILINTSRSPLRKEHREALAETFAGFFRTHAASR
jgi:CubicO group peptidase (beta-lactamase class C family)